MVRTINKSSLLTTAIELRKKGLMYVEIAEQLQVPKTTLYGWLKSVSFTEAQRAKAEDHYRKSKRVQVSRMNTGRTVKRESLEKITLLNARKITNDLTFSIEQKQLLCAIFFWCEGGKNISGGFQFINSDPIMMRTFLTLLRESYIIDESKFRALIHLHDYHDPKKQLAFWSENTGIPKKQFHEPYVKPHTGKNTREGYPGCVSVRYLDRRFGLLLKMVYTNFGENYRGIVQRLV